MYMAGFTHTNSPQDPPPAPGLHTNDNLVSQQVSGFVAGRLYGNLGSFIQITGDPRRRQRLRSTRPTSATPTRSSCSARTRSGASTPTIRRPWKTPGTRRPSFGWPQISSTIAPAFGPPLTHIESGYGQIVGGAGAYVFWNDMLYADFTAYKGLPVSALQAFNDGNSTTDAL